MVVSYIDRKDSQKTSWTCQIAARWSDRPTVGQTEKQTDMSYVVPSVRLTDSLTDRQTDTHTDREPDRQTNIKYS